MTDIKWEDPPPGRSGKAAQHRDLADALRQRPGVWALVREATYPTFAQAIRDGRITGFTLGEFEATSRGSGNKVAVYARYIGPVSP